MSKGIENLPVFALNGRNVFTDNKLSDCFKMNLKITTVSITGRHDRQIRGAALDKPCCTPSHTT